MNSPKLLLILGCAIACLATSIKPNRQCSNVRGSQVLDIDKFVGKWFLTNVVSPVAVIEQLDKNFCLSLDLQRQEYNYNMSLYVAYNNTKIVYSTLLSPASLKKFADLFGAKITVTNLFEGDSNTFAITVCFPDSSSEDQFTIVISKYSDIAQDIVNVALEDAGIDTDHGLKLIHLQGCNFKDATPVGKVVDEDTMNGFLEEHIFNTFLSH